MVQAILTNKTLLLDLGDDLSEKWNEADFSQMEDPETADTEMNKCQ